MAHLNFDLIDMIDDQTSLINKQKRNYNAVVK